MKVTQNSGGMQFTLPQPGLSIARCIRVIQLGTQDVEFKGTKKKLLKVKLQWELPLQTHEFKAGEGEKPFNITKEYTFSIFDQATFRKDIEAWRGGPLTEKELTEGFDPVVLLNKACNLNIAIDKKGDKEYANIKSIAPLAKEQKDSAGNIAQHKQSCPPAVGELVHFDFELPLTYKNLQKLTKTEREKIFKSPEFDAIKNHPEITGNPAGAPVTSGEEDIDEF